MDHESKILWPWPLQGRQKRWAFAFGVLGLAGLILLLLSSALAPPPLPGMSSPARETPLSAGEGSFGREAEMEARLERLLGAIRGAGQVTVMITWEKSPQKVYAQDRQESRQSQEETDGQKTRTSTQESHQWQTVFRQGTSPSPLVVEERGPVVRGVLVVAEGAGDPQVAQALQRAVAVLLGIPTYQVVVVPGKGGR